MGGKYNRERRSCKTRGKDEALTVVGVYKVEWSESGVELGVVVDEVRCRSQRGRGGSGS